MQALLVKLAAWILPILLDWAFKRATKAVETHEAKVAKDVERGKINEKTIQKLKDCSDAQSCIIAARDAFNGTLPADSVVRPSSEVPK